MGITVLELFYNGNGEESQNKIKNRNKIETRIKVSTTLNFIFRLMGTSAICIFGTHSMNFPSFAHLYRQTELDRPRVLRKTDLLVLVEACTSFVADENLNIF